MSAPKSWQFLKGPDHLSYSLYDAIRRRLNRNLVAYLKFKALQGARNRVLEAGSGPAFASSLLAAHPDTFSVALDIDIEALREARRRDPNLFVVVGDLYRLPFRPGAFNLVWNSSTVEHLEEPDCALAEMKRVVAQEGYVFVGVPYRWGPLALQPWIKNTAFGIWLGPVFSRRELLRRMRQARLEPVDTIFYFLRFFIGVLARESCPDLWR